uniref:Nidogen n=1 Tax=Ditylenchus dipsaci TaxID=166011 RepID=A0A915EPD0_9BILA
MDKRQSGEHQFVSSFLIEDDTKVVGMEPYAHIPRRRSAAFSVSFWKCASFSSNHPTAAIHLFERQHTELFISENGAISFSAPITNVPGQELDAEKKDIIAVFYAPSTSGSVFYRNNQGGSPLSREVSAKIRRAFFIDANTFEAESVVLITWENVQQQGSSSANNTYQLAMATDTKNSYAVFVYHKIGWAAASPVNQQPQKYAQAGFFSADGRTEKLVNSGTRAVTDLTKITNFLEPGLFLYRISGSHPQDPRHNGVASLNAEEEYIYQDAEGEYDPDEPITDCPSDPFRDHCPAHCNVVTDDRDCSLCICSSMVSENMGNSPSYSKVSPNHSPSVTEPMVDEGQPPVEPQGNEVSPIVEEGGRVVEEGARVELPAAEQPAPVAPPASSRNADCIHFGQADNTPAGYCCECRPDHYGNGLECLPKDGPQRINGVFEAVINGKAIEKTDLFAYIQVQDGQQHTALARIPKDVGHSLALLDAIGNGMGWLFAKDSSLTPNVFNGFQLTGGSFNRTVNIHLGDRYAIAIKQQFTDREFRDSFAVNMFVSGTLPELAPNSRNTITFPSFQETYKRERSGVIRAYSERQITIQEEGQKRSNTE